MFIYYSNENEVHISHCSIEKPKNEKYEKHFHENYELLLLINGDIECNIDGQNFALLPYDLVFVPMFSYHFVTPKTNNVYENYVINFPRSFIDESRINKLFIPPFIKNISQASKLRRMFSNFDFFIKLIRSLILSRLQIT